MGNKGGNMSFDQWLDFHVHGFVLCLIIMAIAASLSIIGVLVVHRFFSHHRLKGHNDITGPIFGTLGVVYAVLLAFVMIMVWQRFDRIQQSAETEVYCMADLCADAEPFEPSFRQKVREHVGAYARTLIEEWNMLARGGVNDEARNALEKLIKLYAGYEPRSETQKVFFQESVGEVNNLINLRITRIIEGRMGVHPMLWFVLIIGGVITIMFTVFFGSDSLRAKMMMSTLLAISIALVLFAILDFSCPFTGNARVSVEYIHQLILRLGI
jgi:hypothetical protein